AIRELECSDSFRGCNFAPFKINDLAGESTSHVEMTRDGFSFLAFGFTGPEVRASGGRMRVCTVGTYMWDVWTTAKGQARQPLRRPRWPRTTPARATPHHTPHLSASIRPLSP